MARAFIRYPQGETAVMHVLAEAHAPPQREFSKLGIAIAALPDTAAEQPKAESELKAKGFEVFSDIKFEVIPNLVQEARPSQLGQNARYWEPPTTAVPMAAAVSLDDVLDHIGAPQAWATSTGNGVTIAVVDTGTCPTLKEFPASKRSPLDIPSHYHGNHWQDTIGHGSMCATIAAGKKLQVRASMVWRRTPLC